MTDCEYCILPEDLDDIANKNFYLAALGFVVGSELVVERLVSVPESKLRRYERGDYEMKVLDFVELPKTHTRRNLEDELFEMYGKFGIDPETERSDSSREQRLEIAGDIAGNFIQIPHVDSMYLTCSVARGEDDDESDLDLLVVLNSCPGDDGHYKMERMVEAYDCPVDLFIMKRWDFEKNMDSECPFIRDRKLLASR